MNSKDAIFSKLNELHSLIEDHSKGRPIQQKQTKTKEVDLSQFSAILEGDDDDATNIRHQKNKKQVRKLLQQSMAKEKAKAKTKATPQRNHNKKACNPPQAKQTKSKKIKAQEEPVVFEEEEEENNVNQNNDLSIHRDNLQKIFDEWKTLDSIIETSLSPKSIKTNSQNIKHQQNSEHNSNTESKNQSQNSEELNEYSQNSQSQDQNEITPSTLKSSDNMKKRKDPSSLKTESDNAVNSVSSNVYVVEEGTQTQFSDSPHHSNSYASSKNSSNSPHLVDIDNLQERDINFDEIMDNNDFPNSNSDTKTDSKNIPHKPNQKRMIKKNNNNNTKSPPVNKEDSESKVQQKPKEEVIVFGTTQKKSVKIISKGVHTHTSESLHSASSKSTEESLPEHNAPLSSSTSSDLTIEAIESNSSDDHAGQIVESPIKMKVKKQPQFLDPIIASSDSDLDKKKQNVKNRPPQINVPETGILLDNPSKNNRKEIDDDEMDDTEKQDIIEILETSSSDSNNKTFKPQNVILSSSTTPKSTRTPETINPIFSSESESRHTTDNEKEEPPLNQGKSVPIYSSVIDENKAEKNEYSNYKDFERLNQKINDDILLNNIQSSENGDENVLSTDSNEENDKDLPLLHTTDSESDDY